MAKSLKQFKILVNTYVKIISKRNNGFSQFMLPHFNEYSLNPFVHGWPSMTRAHYICTVPCKCFEHRNRDFHNLMVKHTIMLRLTVFHACYMCTWAHPLHRLALPRTITRVHNMHTAHAHYVYLSEQ